MSGETIRVCLAGGANHALTVGREYLIRLRIPGVQKYDREARMGLIGREAGDGPLLFSARGPDRTPPPPLRRTAAAWPHGGAGTQHIEPRWIIRITEVRRDDKLRYCERRAPEDTQAWTVQPDFAHAARPAPAPASPGPGARMRCDCGTDTFWLTGIQVEAVCTGCGERTPLGMTAFTINGVSDA